MSDRERVGQLVYEFLERRFQGELVNVAQVLADHPNLPALKTLLLEAEESHQRYLGRTIPDYELKHPPIGRGGFGEVFLAESITYKYRRALKVVSQQQFSELAGIQEYMKLIPHHPHLVAVHHVGHAGKQYFFYTMPLADNLNKTIAGRPIKYRPKTLASCMFRASGNGGFLPPEQVVAVGCAVAAGLKHLHDKNLVHCDVKPGNILCIGGVWHLGDVGLLKNLKKPSAEDAGTQAYWPPEGPASEPKKADQYALGITLLQAATGFDALDAVGAVQDGKLPNLPGISHFNDIILEACARKPEDRFESVAAMLEKLRAIQARIPKGSSSPSRWRSVFQRFGWKKRR